MTDEITEESKLHELNHKVHGVSGLTYTEPKPRAQDSRAEPWEGYAVVFFPKYDLGFKAQIGFISTIETLSQTAEAARIKFTDHIGGKEDPNKKWTDYHAAGHCIRKVRIIDLGDADDEKVAANTSPTSDTKSG